MNINEIITKLAEDKFKAVSDNLEFILECEVEDDDNRDKLRDALEYIDLLENYIQAILVKVDDIEKNTEKLLAIRMPESKTAKEIVMETSPLICEYKALEEKSEMLWGELNSFNPHKKLLPIKDEYEWVRFQMRQIENILRVKYNYNVIKGCVIDESTKI